MLGILCTEEPLLAPGPGSGGDPEQGSSESPGKGVPIRSSAGLLSDVLYGLINAIVGAPTMISFAAIIFSVRCPYIHALTVHVHEDNMRDVVCL